MKIALLGWGSLIWDHGSGFDTKIGPWESEGPVLPVEFSRISSTRKGALVLVIDRDIGTAVNVLYALSVRDDPDDALADLRDREKTKMKYIGFVDLVTDDQRGRDPEAVAAIKAWAAQQGLDFVAWTDLASNFLKKKDVAFSHEAGLKHLKSLSQAGLREAVKYIVKAPAQVDTSFRQWLQTVAWWQKKVEEFKDDL
jgi:hypothetical protein